MTMAVLAVLAALACGITAALLRWRRMAWFIALVVVATAWTATLIAHVRTSRLVTAVEPAPAVTTPAPSGLPGRRGGHGPGRDGDAPLGQPHPAPDGGTGRGAAPGTGRRPSAWRSAAPATPRLGGRGVAGALGRSS